MVQFLRWPLFFTRGGMSLAATVSVSDRATSWLRPLILACVPQLCGFPRLLYAFFCALVPRVCAWWNCYPPCCPWYVGGPRYVTFPLVLWHMFSAWFTSFFCTLSLLVFAFWWTFVPRCSRELFPWSQVEQHFIVSFCVCISRRTL